MYAAIPVNLRWVALSVLPTAWAQSGGPQSGLKYGENWLPVVKDGDLVAQNFPDVDIELLSPAFLDPQSVPSRFTNGTEGPTEHEFLDVQESFIQDLAQTNDWMSYQPADFLSEEGRTIPYVFLSQPRPQNSSSSTSQKKNKLRVYLQGAIHGNEPAADQSILALLGKMNANQTWTASLLEKMDIKILPRYNVDGVAYFQRQLAVNLDPNREHIKLMREQSRGIKRVVSEYSPHISIDMHEFNAPTVYGGQYQHGADSLISGGINLNIHRSIRNQVLDHFIPTMGARLEQHGLRWEHYATGASNSTPRLRHLADPGRRNAVGLTQAISFLLEMRGIRLGDQHFQRRVATALIKMEAILELAQDRTDEIHATVEGAVAEFIDSDEDIMVTDSYPRSNRTFTMIDQRDGRVVQAPGGRCGFAAPPDVKE
ncbi:hypothetical protein PG988_001860 [Apiospora saccharicola]